jgi:hypothetical protein
MSIEKARLLIRGVTGQLPEGSDLRRQLEWADELLANTENKTNSSSTNGRSFPIPVFRIYKGKRFDAQLLKGLKIEMKGEKYSPSSAAGRISGHPENGWKVWRYVDANSEEQPIDKLRVL